MGMEIRRVPPDWQHPKATQTVWDSAQRHRTVKLDRFQPLYDNDYDSEAQEWMADFDLWRRGEHPHQIADAYFWDGWGPPPNEEYYRTRKWTPEEATAYQIYETVTEGTPVSPIFATVDAMRDWLLHEGYSEYAADKFIEYGSALTHMTSGGASASGIHSFDLSRKTGG